MYSNMLRAIAAGSAMILLAIASIIFQWHVKVPLPGEDDLYFVARPARISWYDQQRFDLNRSCISVYDLETDQLKLRKLEQTSIEEYTLRNGNFVRLMPGRDNRQAVRIMDGETLEKIFEFTLSPDFYYSNGLLDQRYMLAVEDNTGMMLICDLLAPNPEQTRTVPLSQSASSGKAQLMVVDGSNMVVEVSEDPLTAAQLQLPNPPITYSINIYRIDSESIQRVASWTAGHCVATLQRHGNMLLSLTPDCLTLEGRDLETFELVRSSPLPKAIVDNLPWSCFKQDLCEVHNPTSQWRTIFRLDTLQELRGTEGLLVDNWNTQLEKLETPYRLLRNAGGRGPSDPERRAVYDMDRNEIIFDQHFAQSPITMLWEGDRLAVGDRRCGVTVQIFDLKTGELVKWVQPFAWLLPWYVVWSIGAASAAIAWIYYSARAQLSLPTSILLLAAAAVPVQIFPLTQHGTAVNVARPAAVHALAIILSASAGVIWIGFSQIQNRTMRWTYQMSVLSTIVIALVTLELHAAFPSESMLPGVMVCAIASGCAAFWGLIILRLRGYRAQWLSQDPEASSNPKVVHFFALNAASAGLLVACWPLRTMNLEFSKHHWEVALFAFMVVVPYPFVFSLLKMSDRWFARWRLFAFVVAAGLVTDFVASFVRPDLFSFWIDAVIVRHWLTSFMITFLWLWAIRLRGCRLVKPSSGSSNRLSQLIASNAQ